MRLNDFQLAEYFNLAEFQCPCCHAVKLHPMLLRGAIKLRSAWGRAVMINSAYRCGEHNTRVGGAAASRHKQGRALDISVPGGIAEHFRLLALNCGFEKVILYPARGFAHVEL